MRNRSTGLRAKKLRRILCAGASFFVIAACAIAVAPAPAAAEQATKQKSAKKKKTAAKPAPVAATPVLAQGKRGLHYKIGDIDLSISGAVTIGTEIRTSGRDPWFVGFPNAAILGVRSFNTGGKNGDDGNLNYSRGSVVSTVAKGFVTFDASISGFGAHVRPKVWFDVTLANSGVAWGNLPGGYLSGAPVSEKGWNPLARAAGIDLGNTYAYVKRDFGMLSVDARLGNILVPWGLPTLTSGGLINAVNAIDNAARVRPGAQIEEIGRATPGAFLKFGFLDNKATLESFFLFKAPRNVAPGCGTFFSLSDWVAAGCNGVMLGAGSDAVNSVATGFAGRLATPANHQPQYGVGATYMIDPIATKVGAYYSHVAWTAPVPGAMKSLRPAPPFIPGNPGGLNTAYYVAYPDGVNAFTVNFETKFKGTTIYGEYVYRANAPLALNSSDLLNAFGSAAGPTLLRWQYNLLAPGALFEGADRRQVGSLVLGGRQAIPDLLGAKALVVGGEFAMKSVYDLPNKMYRRYGRYDGFGIGPVNGACPLSSIPYQCSFDGYVSSTAWGYQLTAALLYENVFVSGLAVTPTIGLQHDVKGWAYDGSLSQGRVVMNLGLRAEYDKTWFAEVKWNPQLHTSVYDNGHDRQYLTLAAGMKF